MVCWQHSALRPAHLLIRPELPQVLNRLVFWITRRRASDAVICFTEPQWNQLRKIFAGDKRITIDRTCIIVRRLHVSCDDHVARQRSEEHTSELQSHHPISYAVF